MTLALGVLGSLGGIIALLTLIFVIGRGIFKQISATEDNSETLSRLINEVSSLKDQFSRFETRIAILEDRMKRDSRDRRSGTGN